jgi:hypothetical protein
MQPDFDRIRSVFLCKTSTVLPLRVVREGDGSSSQFDVLAHLGAPQEEQANKGRW